MTKTQIFLQNFCHGQICCPKTLESRKKPAENKQTAKAVCYLSRCSYSTVYYFLAIIALTNRAKPEPFDKINAGNPHKYRLSAFLSVIQTLLCKVVVWCNVLILVVKIQEFCPDCTCCVDF